MINYNSGDDIDKLIFIILKRTLKELRRLPRCTSRLNSTLKGAVRVCGNSRRRHSCSEEYYENISYWPGDMNIENHEDFAVLFFARIITNVMLVDNAHKFRHSTYVLPISFLNRVSNMIDRIILHDDYREEKSFLIKYGEEIGEAILACRDISKKVGHIFTGSNAENKFFNIFYPKYKLEANTFLI